MLIFACWKHESKDRKSFYNFLRKWEHSFTDVQRSYADLTLTLLLHNRVDGVPRSRAGAGNLSFRYVVTVSFYTML